MTSLFLTLAHRCVIIFFIRYMQKLNSMKLIRVNIKAIAGLHPAVVDMVDHTASIIYASGPGDYIELSLQYLLKLHPIHLTQSEGRFYVIGGFRSFELARLKLYPETDIECILHKNLAPQEPTLFATVDIFGSPLMHSLGAKYLQQLKALAKPFGNRTSIFFPKMTSLRRLRGHKKSSD